MSSLAPLPSHPPVMQSAPGPETVIDGRRYLYFAGTGYLGLQGDPEVIRAGCEALQRYGVHSATTRAGFGNQEPTLEVERLAAEFFGAEQAFYFISGYLGNNVLLRLLAERFDAVFYDESAHYSLLEALQLARLPGHAFAHRDPEDLAAKLRRHLPSSGRPLVISDGVFPVLGSIAPADDYSRILTSYAGSALHLDDAHAVGVLGANGRGTFEYFGLDQHGVNHDLLGQNSAPPGLFCCGTLSKALGGLGGIIAGSARVIEQVKARSHYYDAASAPAAAVAGATAAGLRIALAHPELRSRLASNVGRLKSGLRDLGLAVDDTPVPILGLVIGDAANMERIQRELAQRGLMIAYTRAYSGVGEQGSLRIAVFANHTDEMLDQLVREMAELV